MEKLIFAITLLLPLGTFLFDVQDTLAQRGEIIYLSPPTYGQIIRDARFLYERNPPDDIDEIIEKSNFTLNYWNDYAADEGGAGGTRRTLKKWVDPASDFILDEFGGPLSGLSKFRDWVDEHVYEDAAEDYKRTRDFEVRETLDQFATDVVKYCQERNEGCIDEFFDRARNDEEFQKQIAEADALGALDESQTWAYLKATAKKTADNVENIEALEGAVILGFTEIKQLFINSFQQTINNQRKIIRNTAKIMYTQQQHTIALTNIQNMIAVNNMMINQGFSNVIGLQQQNLFLSNVIIEGMQVIDARLIDLSSNVADIRATQINEIFKNSSIDQKIKVLSNSESEISQLIIKNHKDGDTYRKQLIANLKAIKSRQDFVNTLKLVSEWGSVAKEALAIFCQDCPSDVSNAVNFGLQMSGIMGNITTGNYAKATLSVLGLFKKPELGPELKMLKQISRQLNGLERNMNAQFKGVHEHLFAIEENLGRRLEIIDLKMDQLAREVISTRIQIMEELGGIDAKLSYIVNQNECIKDIVQVLTNQQNQDVCKNPVSEYLRSFNEERINTLQDLDNFFRGGSCATCIGSLFDVSNVSLPEAAFFRYTQCNAEGQNNKARPDKMYEFIYNNLFGNRRLDPASVASLLYVPVNVTVTDSIYQQMKNQETGKIIKSTQEDGYYRNYGSVIAYTHYVLSLFSFMELYDDGRLLTMDELLENPGFTRERARKMVSVLEDLLSLLNHSLIQQSLMTGNGTMKAIDKLLSEANNVYLGPEAEVNFSLSDLFTYNPYIRKNYSAYLLDKVIGYERLSGLLESGVLSQSSQRIIYQGYSILLSQNKEDNLVFSVGLTNSPNPDENIELFRTSLPVTNGALDKEIYNQNLEFAFPASILELKGMKKAVQEKLAEMYLVTSPELDKEGTDFSREDWMALIYSYAKDQEAKQNVTIQGGENEN